MKNFFLVVYYKYMEDRQRVMSNSVNDFDKQKIFNKHHAEQ